MKFVENHRRGSETVVTLRRVIVRQLQVSEVDIYRADLTWARGLGLRSISLEVFPGNAAAIALYQNAGFRPIVVDDTPTDSNQALTFRRPIP